MIILTDAMVSNSEMMKNYKGCREKAESLGKVFILKNNQLDAILFSVAEYGKFSALFDYIEALDEEEIAKVLNYFQNVIDDKNNNILSVVSR